MVAAKIPYEETKKMSIALPIFNNILVALGEKKLLDRYYTLQSTLHGLSFYEGILNEEATVMYIIDAEKWLADAEKAAKKACKLDATDFLKIAKKRLKIQSEILSKSKELHKLRIQERTIIETLRTKITS
ncbi:MAG: hypothetical protein Q6363_000450 [Candidatus Njordarchaeota archaeon]